jgi:glycosyltransferase involved in cell wall biosynthesis
MRIFFVPGAYDGCYFYRGYLPAIYGEMECVTDFIGKEMDQKDISERALAADAVVFQRPNDVYRVEAMRLLKQKGKFIVFDNDDTYLPGKGVPLNMLGSDKAREIAVRLSENIEKALNIADLVIASTDTLANEYRSMTKSPVVVRKNTIDPLDEWPRKTQRGKFRIGFIGSVASNTDYYHIKGLIEELAYRIDTTIVVLGSKKGSPGFEQDDDFWHNLPNVEWHNFVPTTRYHKMLADLALDVALIPRADNYFNRCKSNVKFLECSLQRIPVIAQGFSTGDSPYQHRKDKKYMQIANTEDEWRTAVENVRNDREKYATLADKAHDYVLEHYNIETYAKDWKNIIIQYATRP